MEMKISLSLSSLYVGKCNGKKIFIKLKKKKLFPFFVDNNNGYYYYGQQQHDQ